MALTGLKTCYVSNGYFSQMLLALRNTPGNSLKLTMFLAKCFWRKNSPGRSEYNIFPIPSEKQSKF